MMRIFRKILRGNLRSDRRGAAVIEMAFALPVLIVLMWMIVQLGLVFRAMSGIQHGLGEGARMATLYSDKTTDEVIADVEAEIEAAVYGIGPGNFDVVEPEPGNDGTTNFLDLEVTYSQATDLLLFPGPTINVTRSKRVWVSI